ncbi:peptide alpha-N-acetyltransferase [Pyrenophora seminiperda CCB06]|uniref:Peptide alpha-N-acetyltransferase n=1 Tax=Pyrenophora seminiperda CCB06 TaxID=1302712 RepID=A0A3M7LUX3_9PLEO|nr:peptide alpha-N-acetyltransferase [Pyrenophora seminiperda CCB06]
MKPRLARIRTARFLFGSAASGAGSASRFSPPLPRNFFTSARQAPAATPLHQSALLFFRLQRSALGRRFQSLRLKSDKPRYESHNPTPHLGSPEPAPSISQRLKHLSREYGWTAVGVYFALSLVDFPLCFLAVRLLGTDRIGHYEEVVKNAFWSVVRLAFPDAGKTPAEPGADEDVAEATAREGYVEAGRAVGHNGGSDASIWTQLGLAYLVHKSLIFFRVPLTAAVLPKVVKTLRSWGYNIGKKKAKNKPM